jgi:hypothetical protein
MTIAAAFVAIVIGVGKLTTLLLSALNVYLASFQLVQVLVIYMAVGLAMFLNPVVPGVPVYITGGVVVVRQALGSG